MVQGSVCTRLLSALIRPIAVALKFCFKTSVGHEIRKWWWWWW